MAQLNLLIMIFIKKQLALMQKNRLQGENHEGELDWGDGFRLLMHKYAMERGNHSVHYIYIKNTT